MAQADISSRSYELPDTIEAIEFYYEHGLTDGLPVIPPTQERVQEFLSYVNREPGHIIAIMPGFDITITAEKVAINAVMAGCLPEYMPVVLAAVEAMAEPQFHSKAIASTCECTAPLMVINGPIRHKINVNSGYNLFGPGWRANATIGRALRLILMNVCGEIPGVLDKATFGQPGRYTYCIAENEELSPWEPFHVERGFPPEASTVTLFAAEGPHEVPDHTSNTPEQLLGIIATSMAGIPYGFGEVMVVIGPEHLRVLASSGWSKQQIKHFLLEKAKDRRPQIIDLENPLDYFGGTSALPGDIKSTPSLGPAEDIMVIVAGGGAGAHTSIIPGWAGGFLTRTVTKFIKEP